MRRLHSVTRNSRDALVRQLVHVPSAGDGFDDPCASSKQTHSRGRANTARFRNELSRCAMSKCSRIWCGIADQS